MGVTKSVVISVHMPGEVFDFQYGEIVAIVGKSEPNCRKLASRARQYVAERKPRFEASSEDRKQLARFLLGLMRKSPPDLTAHVMEVNGMPGVVVYTQGNPLTVFTFDFEADKIRNIYGVVNP